jgi:hypothetical protein
MWGLLKKMLNRRAQGRQQEGGRGCGLEPTLGQVQRQGSRRLREDSGRQVRVNVCSCMRLRRFISGILDPTNATNYRYLVDKYQPLGFP